MANDILILQTTPFQEEFNLFPFLVLQNILTFLRGFEEPSVYSPLAIVLGHQDSCVFLFTVFLVENC